MTTYNKTMSPNIATCNLISRRLRRYREIIRLGRGNYADRRNAWNEILALENLREELKRNNLWSFY